jgi:hypothetical protein
MSRDGSSGGVIRMAVITKEGVERKFYAGDDIPRCVLAQLRIASTALGLAADLLPFVLTHLRFWEGKEILKNTVPGKNVASVQT